MDKKVGPDFWDGVEVTAFEDVVKAVDAVLLKDISEDTSGIWPSKFAYFDSDPENPLTPRELVQYWSWLTEEERIEHIFQFFA